MLRDELERIKYLIEKFGLTLYEGNGNNAETLKWCHSAVTNGFREIRAAWKTAAFSNKSDYSLKRYFHFHLEGIRDILDTLPCLPDICGTGTLVKTELIALIDYHLQYFGPYFNFDAAAPVTYTQLHGKRICGLLCEVKSKLQKSTLPQLLKDCLFSYFDQMDLTNVNAKYTFRSLFYFENILAELNYLCFETTSSCLTNAIDDKLSELNFNHLSYFCYRRQSITARLNGQSEQEQLQLLHDEAALFKLSPESSLIYDQRWPPLNVMLTGWVSEKIAATQQAILQEKLDAKTIPPYKLALNLSVAHLACLLKLFFEENLLNTSSLSDIFRFISRHYRTKRQEIISPGSLSKEFYSTSQVTAAVVRDMLLKMVARINHNFFPVLAAIGAITCVYPEIR